MLSREANAGMLTMNDNGLSLPEVPFGGICASGYRTEGGAEAIEAHLKTRYVTRRCVTERRASMERPMS